ncbi:MAG TPA: EAL domain-containing protein [Noviherbaspirillum sp.]|nr:EAL domain-containing protein [Noviherbaspirillum sp.]
MVTALMSTTHDEAKLNLRLRVFTALSFVIALAIGGAFVALYAHTHALRQHKDAELIAANQGSTLENNLGHCLSATYALASLVRQGGGDILNFETLATEMLQTYGGMRSLQLAKDGVVSQVVPFVGNSTAIGHNLLQDPARTKEAFLALESKRLTLAGPFELMQGGQAVIGRLPVFLPDPDSKEQFWGFTTAVVGVSDLLKNSGLDRMRELGYEYELAHIHADTGKRVVFARSIPTALEDPVVRTIEVPNGKWYLSIAPAQGWLDPVLSWWALAAILILAVIAALLAHSTFKQPILLRREVAQRTQELAESNRSLNEEISERERVQQAVNHLNRLYSVLSHTNAAIVRITNREKLLEEICHVAVELGGFPLARIALLDQRTGTWEWIARCGQDAKLPDSDDSIQACFSNNFGMHVGPILKVCTSAVHDTPQWSAICPQALASGFESHVFLQLRVQGKLAGIFSLYAREADFFDAAQLRLLEEMTEDVSFALENLEREENRKRTENNLRKLSRAVEQSASAVLITDRNGIIEYVNPWFTKITGYTADEVIGKTPSILKSGDTHPETYKRMWDTLLSGKEWTGELHNTKKNGDSYWCLEVISPLKDDAGNITHFVSVTEDISERKQTEQTIRHLAFHDPLTGLPNRRLFNDRLHQAAAMRHRRDNSFALMLLDLDRFKTVNDTLGHDIGDALLKAVAARLLSSTRQGDTLARMGGDEFALIALEISQPEDLARMAEKLISILKEPFLLYGHELYITTSIGVTLYPNDAADAEALIKNADIALYRAKDLGRNNFQFFTGDMNAAMMQRLRLESAMRWAIERREFTLVYQPQVDIISGRIYGTEALIRWKHPEFGMVSPAQFIPLAEETGMIVQIGEWILRTACQQAKAWEDAGMPMRVAVNLSARQFHHGDLDITITEILEEVGLSPELLEVEMTEGILMEDTSQTAAILEKLHAMGVQISIDDFGTGYSSLSYLKRLPIQVLKIDQSFVRDIHTDADDRAIVTAVIALAHSMKLKVVAEGVETPEQLAFLREHRCDIMQGYLFSRPVSGDDVLELLTKDSRLEA